jgi:hypothetical protein
VTPREESGQALDVDGGTLFAEAQDRALHGHVFVRQLLRTLPRDATLRASYPSINAIVHAVFPMMMELSHATPGVGYAYGKPVSSDARFSEGAYWQASVYRGGPGGAAG